MPNAANRQDNSNGGPDPKHNIEAAREEFYQRISKRDMAPLWKVMSSVVTKEPVTRCVPHVWHYDDVKSLVMESGGLITAEEALRRVLILENPGLHGDSLAFFGSGVLPDGAPIELKRSPVINYTYARTRPILDRLRKAGDIDKSHGVRVRYANPINGGPVLPTMGANLALLPKGFKGEKYRSTDGTIFVCTEGGGTTKVEDTTLEWGTNDDFVVPPWKRYSHQTTKDSVLFSISDQPAQVALGIWREDKNPS